MYLTSYLDYMALGDVQYTKTYSSCFTGRYLMFTQIVKAAYFFQQIGNIII